MGEEFETDVDASIFDDPATEPLERLPRLTLGKYTVKVDKTLHKKGEKGEYFIAELTVVTSEGPEALPAGARASYMEKLDVTGYAKKYMARRIKGFVYTITQRRGIEGRELLKMLNDPAQFESKSVNATVAEQKDDGGDPKVDEKTGVPYTEISWSATA